MQRLEHEQVYLDTNIVIAALEAFHARALELVRMAELGEVFLITSEVTRGEMLVKPFMETDQRKAERINAFFDNPDLVNTIAADGEVMQSAARLSASAGLELLDAVHCATAEIAGCTYILSQDRDFQSYAPMDVLSLDDLEARP